MNVLDFIEGTSKRNMPQAMTLKRTATSRYLFYLLVRHYRQELVRKPRFLQYTRQDGPMFKALIEEVSVFGSPDLYALEGFPMLFVDQLAMPEDTFCVAETDDGELEAMPYSYRERRGILLVLVKQLQLPFSLRSLLSLDWSPVRDYPEIERWLRKAHAAGWEEEELGEKMKRGQIGNVLEMMKRGNIEECFEMRRRYGDAWFLRHCYRSIPQLAQLRALKALGQSDGQISEALDLSVHRVRELEEVARMIPTKDLRTLGETLVKNDRIFRRHTEKALDLLILRSPIGLKRGPAVV